MPSCYDKGYKQSPEHIAKRALAIKANGETWSDAKKEQWRLKISASKRGCVSWHKGHNWRNKLTPEELKEVLKMRARRLRNGNTRLRINERMGSMIYQALKTRKNGHKWEDLVDYSLDELLAHLENQFKEGMSWGNTGEWHIDHIIPRSNFHFNSPDDIEFRECWALENLQPLWAADNLKKGSRNLVETR